jgi:hypothetical protein
MKIIGYASVGLTIAIGSSPSYADVHTHTGTLLDHIDLQKYVDACKAVPNIPEQGVRWEFTTPAHMTYNFSWKCEGGKLYIADRNDFAPLPNWTKIIPPEDAAEEAAQQAQQEARQAQQAKDEYLKSANVTIGFHLNLIGAAYKGPHGHVKFRVHITPQGRIDSIRVLEGDRNMAFLRQVQFQLGQISDLGQPPEGCDFIDTAVNY